MESTQVEVFRFMFQRPIQKVGGSDYFFKPVKCYLHGHPNTNLFTVLERFREQNDRILMEQAADSYIESPKYVSSLDSLYYKWDAVLAMVLTCYEVDLNADFFPRIEELVGATIKEWVTRDHYHIDRNRLADSIIACVITTKSSIQENDFLIDIFKVIGLSEYLAASASAESQTVNIRALFDSFSVVIPNEIFPLPDKHLSKKNISDLEPSVAEPGNETENIKQKIGLLKQSLTYLKSAKADSFNTPSGLGGEVRRHWTLQSEYYDNLNKEIIDLLEKENLYSDKSFFEIYNFLENELTKTTALYFRKKTFSTVMLYGNRILTNKPILKSLSPPDACSEVATSQGVRLLGIGDLMIVRQKLKKYELGEIAHIENVLRGEYKERVHRRSQTIEEEIKEEEELVSETESDLQTSERFEMKNESKETIKTDQKLEAGVNISGSYGPCLSVSSHANVAASRSIEQSNQHSTTYAKDIVQRSRSKIEERTRRTRTRKATEEVEETNTHGFDNKGKTDHAIGLYRWVDKIYEAQLVNYGKRVLYESIIPEPSALYLYALNNQPPVGFDLIEPDSPLCDEFGLPFNYEINSQQFTLSPLFIDSNNYLIWAAKYEVTGIEPPPAEFCRFGKSFSEGPKGDSKMRVSDKAIVFPEGLKMDYEGHIGIVSLAQHENDVNTKDINVSLDCLLGVSLVSVDGRGQGATIDLHGEREEIPLSMKVHRESTLLNDDEGGYAFNVEIMCQCTPEALYRWKIKTYESIISAYTIKKEAYETQLNSIRGGEEKSINGRNPEINLEIMRTELKKGAISMLTRQRFDSFSSICNNINSEFPEIDFDKASENGNYIQFLEQAFEWANMTYLFYPYFWGRKVDTWLSKLTQIVDVDSNFEQFLKAGAARLVLPVRPGYEDAVAFFIEYKKIWMGGKPPVIGSPLYLSIENEIMQQQIGYREKGGGVISVTKGSVQVLGKMTDFKLGDLGDEGREIYIKDETYIIKRIANPWIAVLSSPYKKDTEADLEYSMGVKQIGSPWEVRLPTNLVMLQENTKLPDFTTDNNVDSSVEGDTSKPASKSCFLYLLKLFSKKK